MGPKKGVISQSVKDVIQSLVDDDLVLKDKIGTSVSILFGRVKMGFLDLPFLPVYAWQLAMTSWSTCVYLDELCCLKQLITLIYCSSTSL